MSSQANTFRRTSFRIPFISSYTQILIVAISVGELAEKRSQGWALNWHAGSENCVPRKDNVQSAESRIWTQERWKCGYRTRSCSPLTPRLTLSTHHAYEHPATARFTLQRIFRGHKAPSFQRSSLPTFLGSLETQVSSVSKNQCILYLYAQELLTILPSFSCVTIVRSFNFFFSSAVFAGLLPTLYSPDVFKNDFRVNICSPLQGDTCSCGVFPGDRRLKPPQLLT